MKNAIALTNEYFESSCYETPQYKTWYRTFKREFSKFLTDNGATNIQIGKPNHFDMSGFFTNHAGQIFYFSISDLRWSKDTMLVRTAKDYKDYTGGTNQFVSLKSLGEFADGIKPLVQPSDTGLFLGILPRRNITPVEQSALDSMFPE